MKITALITTAIIALSIFAAAPATAKTTDSMDERIAAVLDERLGRVDQEVSLPAG